MRQLAFRLALLLIFVIPWENAFAIEALGSIARLVGLLAAGVWGVSVLMSGGFRKPHAFHAVALLFVAWNALTFFWSADPAITLDRVTTFLQLLILAFLVWDLFKDQGAIKSGMQAYVLGCYVSIGAVLTSYLTSDAYTQYYTADRFSGAGQDPNDLGVIVAIGIPMAWFMYSSYRASGGSKRLMALVNALYIPAAVVAVMLTGSRTASMAVLVAIIYVVATLGKARSKGVIAIATGLLIVALALPLLPDATLGRILGTVDALEAGELSGRTTLWSENWRIFLDNPAVGVGSGGFAIASGTHATVAHNVLLGILGETGLVGFALFTVILGVVAFSALRQSKEFAWLWLTTMAIWFIGAMSLSLENRKLTWLLLPMVIASEWAMPGDNPPPEHQSSPLSSSGAATSG